MRLTSPDDCNAVFLHCGLQWWNQNLGWNRCQKTLVHGPFRPCRNSLHMLLSIVTENPCLDRKDGIYLHAHRCDWFLRCSAGVAYEQPCSTGLHFSRKTNSCDYPLEARCPCEYHYIGGFLCSSVADPGFLRWGEINPKERQFNYLTNFPKNNCDGVACLTPPGSATAVSGKYWPDHRLVPLWVSTPSGKSRIRHYSLYLIQNLD